MKAKNVWSLQQPQKQKSKIETMFNKSEKKAKLHGSEGTSRYLGET